MNILPPKSFALADKKLNSLAYLFILAGLFIRLFHYFSGRSLWLDEGYLATSLVKFNYGQLITHPLYYQQKAPIGFMLLVKFFLNLFGNRETVLRIVPLISGILSLFVFIPVAKHFLKEKSVVLAIAILCLSPALTFHAVEIKQYSTELLCALLSFYLLIKFEEKTDLKSLFLWGIYGAAILWFSYSSIFILGGIAVALSLKYLYQKRWQHFLICLIPFGLWLFSFVINYLLFTHKHAESEWIVYWFKAYGNFMPLPPKSGKDLMWFSTNIYRMLDYPLGLLWNFMEITNRQGINMVLKMPFIPLLFLGIGAYSLFKTAKTKLAVLLIPVCFMCLASGLELYPLTERFWVFISPVFIILIARGFSYFLDKARSKAISLIVFLLMIAGPVSQSAYFLLKPQYFYSHKKSYQREALMYLNQHYQPGDAVYVYWNNLSGYRIYKLMYNFKYSAIEGTDQRLKSKNYTDYYHNLSPDFEKFKGKKRIWLVYNTVYITDIGDKIDDPNWYYEGGPINHLVQEFSKNYQLNQKFKGSDVTIMLLMPR